MKAFLVETLLNLVIYFRNTQKHRFPLLLYLIFAPNYTRIHVTLKVPQRLVSTVVHACINISVQE